MRCSSVDTQAGLLRRYLGPTSGASSQRFGRPPSCDGLFALVQQLRCLDHAKLLLQPDSTDNCAINFEDKVKTFPGCRTRLPHLTPSDENLDGGSPTI